MKRTVSILSVFLMIMMLAASGSFAATYGYQINLLSGNQGVFKGGQTKITIEKGYGEWISIDVDSLNVKLSNDKYFVKGLKKAGSDTNSSEVIHSITMQVEEDQSYIVVYGLKKDMVEYTVSYLDKDGNKLLEDDTYYGAVGDKPTVSFKFVDGYVPEAYNEKKTLSKDEAQNVFRFYYDKSGSVSESSAAPAKESKTESTDSTGKNEKADNTGKKDNDEQTDNKNSGKNDSKTEKNSEQKDSDSKSDSSKNTTIDNNSDNADSIDMSNDTNAGGQQNRTVVQNNAVQTNQAADQAANIDNADNDGNNDQGNGDSDNKKPKKLVDLDDNETPLASGDRNKNKAGFLAQNWILITSIAVVLGALVLAVFLKRKKKTDAEE